MGQTTLNQMKQVKTSAILIGAPRCSWDRAVNWLHPLSLLQLCVSCLVKLSCKNNIFLLVLCTLFFYSVSVSLFRWTWWKYNPVNGLLYCFINAIGYCQIPAMWWHHSPGVSANQKPDFDTVERWQNPFPVWFMQRQLLVSRCLRLTNRFMKTCCTGQ